MKRIAFGFRTDVRIWLLAVLAVCAVTPAAHADSNGKWTRAKLASNAVEGYRKKFDVPGVSVAIMKDGKILYAQGFGWKNHAKKIKASTLTRFRLASVSKPISAILALELADQGKLNLDAKIRTILNLPKHHDYTVRDLLSHQSGVRHYKDKKDPTKNVSKHYSKASDAIKLFVNDKLVMTPRSKYSYTTHGYSILAAAMEKKSGDMFFLHAKKRFSTWGLKDLELENSGLTVERNRSEIYRREKGKNKVSKRDDISWKGAGGGMHSTATDLAKLGMMLIDGKILKKSTRDAMWTQRKTKSGGNTGYGLGWGVGSTGGRKIVAHSGSQNGANSYWRIYPNDRVVIVVLSNRNGHQPAKLGAYLGSLVFASAKAKPIPTW